MESEAVATATVSNCHPCPPAKLLLAILDKRYIISSDFFSLKWVESMLMIITLNEKKLGLL